MLELRQLRMVREIASSRSITKAASNLFLTQSAVSQQLKSLEEQLGVSLFSRENKTMVINAFGLKLLETESIVEAQLKRLDLDIRAMKQGFRYSLTFSTECYTSYYWISAFLNSLEQEVKSSLNIIVQSEYTRDPLPPLIAGHLDFAIVTTRQETPQLQYLTLFDDELVAICPERHWWKTKKTVAPKDFADEHFIEYNTDRKNLDAYRCFFNPAGKFPRVSTKIELTEAIIQMVKAGLGVAIMSKWVVLPILRDGGLRTLRLNKGGVYRRWYLCCRSGLPAEKKAMIQTLGSRLKKFLKAGFQH